LNDRAKNDRFYFSIATEEIKTMSVHETKADFKLEYIFAEIIRNLL
jgi:hypothetical protein